MKKRIEPYIGAMAAKKNSTVSLATDNYINKVRNSPAAVGVYSPEEDQDSVCVIRKGIEEHEDYSKKVAHFYSDEMIRELKRERKINIQLIVIGISLAVVAKVISLAVS